MESQLDAPPQPSTQARFVPYSFEVHSHSLQKTFCVSRISTHPWSVSCWALSVSNNSYTVLFELLMAA